MTAPMIGNYGINLEDMESERPQVSGVVVRELSRERFGIGVANRLHSKSSRRRQILIPIIDQQRRLRLSLRDRETALEERP